MPSRRSGSDRASAPLAERSLAELQQRQRTGELRVLCAADFRDLVQREGLASAYRQTDVVTAADCVFSDQGTLLLSLGPCDPPIRLRELQLSAVAAQVGGSGSDLLLPLGGGLAEASRRSGAQVLADLLAGAALPLQGIGDPTAMHPRTELSGVLRLGACTSARLLLHRAITENGIVAVNSAEGLLRTAHGPLLGPLVSGLYTGGGAGSIGMTMPALAQLGAGSAVLVGGGLGLVVGAGTAHNPSARRQPSGHACVPGATAAVSVDLEQLDPGQVRACFLDGHGAAVLLPIAAPVLLLNPALAAQAAADHEALQAPVLDLAIPRRVKPQLGSVSYGELLRGTLQLGTHSVRCAPAHSPRLAAAASRQLRDALVAGQFPLGLPLQPLTHESRLRAFDP